ncbi:hypothetical protein [Pseudomonas sp. RA_35y_Pfl2_P32]|uniref:hypothetical protein n=1 Tax=Pseudomonas sp. RA_35y_Pfl2_P32 TaxID=3088705 RepID=UPI0030DCB1FD
MLTKTILPSAWQEQEKSICPPFFEGCEISVVPAARSHELVTDFFLGANQLADIDEDYAILAEGIIRLAVLKLTHNSKLFSALGVPGSPDNPPSTIYRRAYPPGKNQMFSGNSASTMPSCQKETSREPSSFRRAILEGSSPVPLWPRQ